VADQLSVDTVRANLARIREQIPDTVEILAAVKYIDVEQLQTLAEAGITLVGENRARELRRKAESYPDTFTWDFIGHLQSRKVKDVLRYVRYIHSVASDSVLTQLERHGTPDTEVLIEVNIAGEPGKTGIAPNELESFIARCPVRVVGLLTMPPLAHDPELSRPHFAALRELAARHGLAHLSMGTSQDYLVAVQEGATIVRLGTILYEDRPAAA
jgi:uncharacterized pyridoxal phosphate-containing UPF0001 family protein